MEDIRLAGLVTLLLALGCWWYRHLPPPEPDVSVARETNELDAVVHAVAVAETDQERAPVLANLRALQQRQRYEAARRRQAAEGWRCPWPTGRVHISAECMNNALCPSKK